MGSTYTPESLGIKAPPGGFQRGGWYSGRQMWGGTLGDVGTIHPASDQQGAGQAVSQEVNLQSDVAQGLAPGSIEKYLTEQRQQQQQAQVQPVAQQTVAAPMQTTRPQATGGAGVGLAQPQSAINLPEIYKGLQESSGISALETQYSQMEKDFIEAKGKINDNPFLSEATRVGREAKLQKLFDERTANIRGDIATQKADIETQLNLQMKQFDINSQQTQMAWEQFNALLGMGALSGASGEDIANITRSTGISSSMIQSAISESQKKDINSQVIQSEDASGNVTISVINKDTGAIISQQSLGQIGTPQKVSGTSAEEAKPGSSEYVAVNKGAVSQFLSANTNSYGHVSPDVWQRALQAWMDDVLGTRDEFIKNYSYLTDPIRGDFKEQSSYGFDLSDR